MEDDDDEGPFRYRSGVRVIAAVDVVLSIYLLAYLGIMVFILDVKDTDIPMGTLTVDQHRNITVAMWITLLLVYFFQLLFAFVLICASNNCDMSACRSKCQFWLWYANLLCLVLVLEIGLLVANFSRHGMRVYPMAMWGVKIIFRLIARQLVKYYIKDLSTGPPNTVESQFYTGVPRMYRYSSEYLTPSGSHNGTTSSKKNELKY